jgi:galactose oxidase
VTVVARRGRSRPRRAAAIALAAAAALALALLAGGLPGGEIPDRFRARAAADHGDHRIRATVAAFRDPYQNLDRTGWTASASSAEDGSPAGEALDGDNQSVWRSAATPHPHAITIDTGESQLIAGLRYTPLVPPGSDGRISTPGTIGGFAIATSPDGVSWTGAASGTWADDSTRKLAVFPAVRARFVRLTALGDAGGRGPAAAAAELDLLSGTPAAPSAAASQGVWSNPIGFPIVPVSAVLLPSNKLLTFSAHSPVAFDTPGYTQISILDLATGQVSRREIRNTGHEMFCTGIALLPDGRVLITGGGDTRGQNAGRTTIYDPRSDSWGNGPEMRIPRGYQTSTTLSTGQVFALGGSWSGGLGGKDAEIFTPDGSWERLPNVSAQSILTQDRGGIYRSDNHGWFFATSGGGVFHAGPSSQMNWFSTAGAGATTSAGTRADAPDMMNGVAVMYDAGKILTAGGSPHYQDSDATSRAYAIDISGGPGRPVPVSRVGDMASPRAFHNAVVLPDGKVLVTGGMRYAATFNDDSAVRPAELWDPATGRFSVMAAEAIPRTYHSVSVLLPDARVLSGGGGLCGSCAVNHADAQIFTPPYLLAPDGSPRPRPAITRAPAEAPQGAVLSVRTDRPASAFSLVRVGSATHSINSDQRRVALAPTRVGTNHYRVTVPADAGVAVPGFWMLFALDAAGTPSVGRFVRIDQRVPAPAVEPTDAEAAAAARAAARRGAPRLSRLGVRVTRLAKGTRRITVGVRVSEAARVRLALQQFARGVRTGSRCRAAVGRVPAGARRCLRWVEVRRASVRAKKAGAVTLRLSPRRMAPGTYRVIVTAVDAGGTRSRPSLRRFGVR